MKTLQHTLSESLLDVNLSLEDEKVIPLDQLGYKMTKWWVNDYGKAGWFLGGFWKEYGHQTVHTWRKWASKHVDDINIVKKGATKNWLECSYQGVVYIMQCCPLDPDVMKDKMNIYRQRPTDEWEVTSIKRTETKKGYAYEVRARQVPRKFTDSYGNEYEVNNDFAHFKFEIEPR